MILEKRWYRYKSRQSQYNETAHNNLRSRILKSYHVLIQGLHGANRLLCPFSGNEHYTFRLLLHATCFCSYVIINLQTWDNPFSSSRWVLPYIFTCIHGELLLYLICNRKFKKKHFSSNITMKQGITAHLWSFMPCGSLSRALSRSNDTDTGSPHLSNTSISEEWWDISLSSEPPLHQVVNAHDYWQRDFVVCIRQNFITKRMRSNKCILVSDLWGSAKGWAQKIWALAHIHVCTRYSIHKYWSPPWVMVWSTC